MFLNLLSKENKERFLKLSVHAAFSDGLFVDDEEKMIKAYCHEMELPESIPEVEDSLGTVIEDIAVNTDDTEKKIITLEILGLIKSDGIYDDKEKIFMSKVIAGLKIEEDVWKKLEDVLTKYTDVCKELYSVVFGE